MIASPRYSYHCLVASIATAVTALLFAAATWAQSAQSVPPQFPVYFNSIAYREMVAAKVLDAEIGLGTACHHQTSLHHGIRALIKMPVFDGNDEVPTSGAWVDRTEVDRCGKTIAQNILVAFTDGKPSLTALLPGATRAAPRLQRDALPTAFTAASVKQTVAERQGAPDCADKTKFSVIDTRLDRERIPIRYNEAGKMVAVGWDETWIFLMCGREIPVVVHFNANGQGGTNFNVDPEE
jgi:hypothetical protein